MFIKDSKGNKSATTTVFIIGSLVATLKLLLAGSTFGSVSFGDFSGIDAAAVFAALGSIYSLRRSKFMNEGVDDGRKK